MVIVIFKHCEGKCEMTDGERKEREEVMTHWSVDCCKVLCLRVIITMAKEITTHSHCGTNEKQSTLTFPHSEEWVQRAVRAIRFKEAWDHRREAAMLSVSQKECAADSREKKIN
ncbi:hypothetical protein VNO77_39296 [Canavalia gladiata]|uniref:Uncharacterized protein n=1 Tax=Canavalia gladiata TaxID=3824 RepID=A0AAN9KCE0_CANGL